MQKGKAILSLVIGLVIAGLVIGLVFPIGMNSLHSDTVSTNTLSDGETVNVEPYLNVTLNNVSDPDDTVNLTLNDTKNDVTYTVDNLALESSETVETDLGNVTVKFTEKVSSTSAKIEVTTSSDFGWDDAEQDIYGILGIFLILAIIVALAGWAMKAYKG